MNGPASGRALRCGFLDSLGSALMMFGVKLLCFGGGAGAADVGVFQFVVAVAVFECSDHCEELVLLSLLEAGDFCRRGVEGSQLSFSARE